MVSVLENDAQQAQNALHAQYAPMHPIAPKAPENEFYEIRAVPGKGYGSFALKDLKRGTRILSDPILIAITETDYFQSDIELEFAKLSEEQKQQYWSLASAHGQNPRNWPSRIHDSVKPREASRIKEQHSARISASPSLVSIFQTNCMEWHTGAAIFSNAARFNHSCVPNANFNWNENLQRETIHIIQDVPAGEQITISYCDLTHERTVRAWELKHYGFTCDCKACVGDEERMDSFLNMSAERRHRIEDLQRETSILRGPNLEQGVKDPQFVRRLLDMAVLHMEIEDYSVRLANIYLDLALCCEHAKDFKNGQDMAANALRIKRDCQGADSVGYDQFQGILKRLHRAYKAQQAEVKKQAEKENDN